jgi:thiamine biosynthesis lipoprotein
VNARYSRLPVRVSDELWAILLLCRGYYEKTLYLFDVTLKDFSQVNFHDNQSISFGHKGLSFDFGGFAKGYALKKIKEILLSGNIKHAFVDFGSSSILTIGHHPYGNCWKVSFTSPYDQLNLREFDLRDTALSVSGNTQQYFRHIINPLTGIYNEQRKASTIISDNPLDAEVLSNVWMITDEKKQEQINMNFKDIQGTIYTL